MPSIFTRIINGEIPCHRIAENDEFIAFLDVRPIVKGHTLVVPKKEIDYIFDNDDAILAALLPFSKRVAAAIEAIVPCKRCFVSVIGLEVPHTHVHLIPANRMGDYSFKNKVEMSAGELAELAKAIAEKFV
jgi:histidine triad (HIT) family protein